ncbi:FAD-binding oxidoreductase [Streptomyces sp. NPDC050658]|uniref:FAD-binding oxidoreductase n=1 Tax=unclassified Streptomyces TaxID=2593676 RepID=UPI00341EE01A
MSDSNENTAQAQVTRRDDVGYGEIRQELCWNTRVPNRFPDAIARAVTVDEVRDAVRFAAEHGLQVSPRGSGHSWVTSALRDKGLMLDLSRLTGITIDPQAMTATVEPGVTGDQLATALAACGLAFPVGHCPGIGLSGYLLGGGIPWNAPTWGPACKSVRAVDVVLASGELVRADADRHADLLWAARGGGAGFPGVITRYELQLYPLPRAMRVSQWLYPMDMLDEVVRWAGAAAEEVAPSGQILSYLRVAPPSMVGVHGGEYMILVQGVAYVDTEAEARKLLSVFDRAPVSHRGKEVARCRPTTFAQLQTDLGELYPEPRRYAVDHMWLGDTNLDELLALTAKHLRTVPSEDSNLLFLLIPAGGDPLPDMAFSKTDRIFFSPNAIWEDARHDAVNLRWVDDVVKDFEPFATGYYVNETDLFRGAHRASGAFAATNWVKLREVVAQYDPNGVFTTFPELS